MRFGDGLLAALNDRASELVITHLTRFGNDPDGFNCECICGAGVQSQGFDESSRNAVSAWAQQHKVAAVLANREDGA